MALTVIKHSGPWVLLTRTFRFKTSSFEQMIENSMFMVYKLFYEELVVKLLEIYSVALLTKSKICFKVSLDVALQH